MAQGSVITSACGQYRYHISIIDYLQRYTCKKFGERWFKILFKRAIPWEVSSMAPDAYGDRFESYMKATVFNRRMQEALRGDFMSRSGYQRNMSRVSILSSRAPVLKSAATRKEEDSGRFGKNSGIEISIEEDEQMLEKIK